MTSSIGKIFGGGDRAPDPVPPPPAPRNEAIEARGTDFATRERSLDQRASAAGAQRSDNDADVLGYALPRKRSAGREILG